MVYCYDERCDAQAPFNVFCCRCYCWWLGASPVCFAPVLDRNGKTDNTMPMSRAAFLTKNNDSFFFFFFFFFGGEFHQSSIELFSSTWNARRSKQSATTEKGQGRRRIYHIHQADGKVVYTVQLEQERRLLDSNTHSSLACNNGSPRGYSLTIACRQPLFSLKTEPQR